MMKTTTKSDSGSVSSSSSAIQASSLAASSIAAAVARLATHPLDTIRLRIQTQLAHPRPPLRSLIPTSAPELYAGLPVALLFSVPALSIYLSSYQVAKRFWTPLFIDPAHSSSPSSPPSLMQQFPAYMLSGLSAEIVSGWVWSACLPSKNALACISLLASFYGLFWAYFLPQGPLLATYLGLFSSCMVSLKILIRTPMEVTKSRLQKGNEGTSAIQLLRKIARTEGVKGIWRGYTVSLAVYGALYWPAYEQTKSFFIPSYDPTSTSLSSSNEDNSAIATNLSGRYALCAALSCIVSAGLTHPIAVVQSTVQTSGGLYNLKSGRPMGSIRSALNQIWKEGGPKGFTRGAVARMFYMVPSNIISMSTYELLKVHWGVK